MCAEDAETPIFQGNFQMIGNFGILIYIFPKTLYVNLFYFCKMK